jgi:hypothetical protein
MTKMFYRGYEITVVPHQIQNKEDWAVKVRIHLFKGDTKSQTDFLGPEKQYPSMEEATNAGLAYGKHVIDNFPDKLHV